ncbi:uncharacterized mitochondrial protein AtMg00810-like [Lycium ferocissimum]|uniref:uncharacterized mitochondrial protein AtMg00810-like n=1 Tax=Lycium ferocissimum TaxID=112874 RepID=UPI0028167175|nr:uncharacterized mitochondrial protein AtMg00810-like [Lycium ferocissimum]
MKELGELRYFLGIEFSRSKDGIPMAQRKYALELIAESGLAGSRPKETPMEQNLKLTSVEFDKTLNVENSEDDKNLNDSPVDEVMEDRGRYQRLIGKLLYLTITRPDISYAVQSLSQFMQSPKNSHYEAALNVVKYIKKQPGLGLLMSSGSAEQVASFCDSDWASCPMSRKSVT